VVEDDMTLIGLLAEQNAFRLFHTHEDEKDMTINDFMTQTAIHFKKKKPSLDICYFLRDKKDSVALTTEKANDQRAEQRLRYRWPVRFTKGVKEKTSPGQIVDVSSRGLAMLCHANNHCPHQDQAVKVDFGVPHFDSADSLEAVLFNRIGRVCRIDNLSSMVNRVAVQFAEPLFFKPGEQNISEFDAQQRLEAKTYSITRAEEKAKVYSEALARTGEKLRSYAEAKARAEERVKIEAKARATAEEKVRAEIQIRANLEAQMQEKIKSYNDQIAKIKAEATEAMIWAKAEAEYTVAKVKDEFQQKGDVYAEVNIRAEERAKIKAKTRTKAVIFIVLMLVVGTLSRFYPKQRDKSVDYYNRGSIHLRKNEYDQAIFGYTKAIEIAPKMAKAYYNRGNAYIAQGQYDKAIFDYTKAIEINPGLTEAYYNRGLSYAMKGEYDQAIYDYTRAIEINPKMAEAFYNRGNAYIAQGQYDKAIFDYTKATEVNPGLTEAYYNRGLHYAMKGEYDRAILDYNKAIEMAPKMAKAYYNRGNAYIAQGQYDQTILDYTKAIEINPRLGSAYYNRALAYYDKREYNKAWQDVHKAESLGCQIQPGFLKVLRKASGRVK
jgi:tetratricopeptide (TPR) repeat protein